MASERIPRLVLTMGDPSGIGPEVIVKALCDPTVRQRAHCLVVGNAVVMQRAVELVGAKLPVRSVSDFSDPAFDPDGLNVLDAVALDLRRWTPRQPNAESGLAAIRAIEVATQLVLQGVADALVTAPIHKAAAHQAGLPFAGHTEFLAALCGVTETRLMLVCDELRVIHVTGHMALRDALAALTPERIVKTVELALPVLKWLGFDHPRIAIAALNPHAGEEGAFGDEEERLLRPAVERLRASGLEVSGPVPADSVFWQAWQGAFDLVVALYHDQGHIPVKVLAFDRAVNVTAGLPIIRTSPDHGVALDIAWQNKARATSLMAALRLAAEMAKRRSSGRNG
jgi:4-hydroxythreonine-4-phosphate dehydrogenase